MGLCKCPKKKVTNQFCFEHRVNVCEHCMMTSHPKCIVQSYLQWLKDSDYNPICELCRNSLLNDDCVRLVCYHVFHWPCLDHYARQLPPNTAPAGYTCPTCNAGIFPHSNLVSPVADKLVERLSEVNWARTGLGLPLVEEVLPVSSRSAPDGSNEESKPVREILDNNAGQFGGTKPEGDVRRDGVPLRPSTPHRKSPFAEWSRQETGPNVISPDHSVIDVGSPPFQTSTMQYTSFVPGILSPKRTYDSRDSDQLGSASFDHDEKKYERRSALEWFSRWFKTSSRSGGRRDPKQRTRRYLMFAVLVLLGLVTVIIIMARVGRANADVDPFLDPMANPNIRVLGDHEKVE